MKRIGDKRILVALTAAMLAGQGYLQAAPKNADAAPTAGGGAAHQVSPGRPPRVVMFRLNEEEFTVQDYVNFLQTNPQIMRTAISSDAGKAEAVREMATVSLLRIAMFKEKLLEDKKDLPRADILKAYEELAQRHFPRGSAPDEEKAYAYYLQHPGDYGISGVVRLNEIMFKVPAQADTRVRNQARDKAETAMKRLEHGESFAQVSADMTENPVGRVAKGDIGYEVPDMNPWMKEAIKDKKQGDRTGIVESPEGLVILEVTDIKPSMLTPYADVRDKVIKDMLDKEQKKLRNAFVNDLAKNVKVDIVEPTLKPVMKDGIFPLPLE